MRTASSIFAMLPAVSLILVSGLFTTGTAQAAERSGAFDDAPFGVVQERTRARVAACRVAATDCWDYYEEILDDCLTNADGIAEGAACYAAYLSDISTCTLRHDKCVATAALKGIGRANRP